MRSAGHLFQGHVRRTSAQRRSQRAVQSTLAFVGLLAVFGCESSHRQSFEARTWSRSRRWLSQRRCDIWRGDLRMLGTPSNDLSFAS